MTAPLSPDAAHAPPRAEARDEREEPETTRRGFFVTFEGIEGSGKSTQIARLAERLVREGLDVVTTREPGGTELGLRLRAVLLECGSTPVSPWAELLLYAADRAEHMARTVRPALDRGAIVLCDRHLDASLAYQGYGRGLPLERIREIHRIPPLDRRPDRTVLLDIDPETGLARARSRNARDGTTFAEGRFEAETLAFHRRVRNGYLQLARAGPERFRIVPGDEDADRVECGVLEALLDLLPGGEENPS